MKNKFLLSFIIGLFLLFIGPNLSGADDTNYASSDNGASAVGSYIILEE